VQQLKGNPQKINKTKSTTGPKNKQNKKHNGAKTQQCQQWGPKGATASVRQFAGASVQHTVTPDPNSDLHREIYHLRAMLAATTPTPVQHWTPAPDPSAFPPTSWPYPGESPTAFTTRRPIRPRSHYCWLHGWNTSHNSPQCKKMMASAEYTSLMRAAASPEGNGGNPNVGPPVTLPFSRCLPCLTPVSLSRPQDSVSTLNNRPTSPNDDNAGAGLATIVRRPNLRRAHISLSCES
jgi:hypothetical protein